ncbi:hypothetical protein Pint_01162 [Pistacia integerrima]|uniref:Uncharacterized protein n=1 Tax=Pistacia integerrima TaxID=434235 RepID=A0ACC0ZN40_9ROSI|nr:hypothetical protein Pint_01162 [Pistacia integerrima]
MRIRNASTIALPIQVESTIFSPTERALLQSSHSFPPNSSTERMTIRLKFSKTEALSLDKFIKAQKNLSQTPPILWSKPKITVIDNQHVNHPISQELESCTRIKDFHQIHAQLVVSGLSQDSFVASRVLKKLCTSLSSVSLAVVFFDCLEEPDAFMCNTIMKSFLSLNDPSGALRFYHEKMLPKCVEHNHYTFPLLGKICAEEFFDSYVFGFWGNLGCEEAV